MLTCLKTIHGNEEPNGGKKIIFYTLKSCKKRKYCIHESGNFIIIFHLK